MSHPIVARLVFVGLVAILVGCPDDGPGIVEQKPVVVSVSVSPDTLFMRPGDTGELTAVVTGQAGVSEAVDLSSSNVQVATVDANRRVTAVANGQAYIRAISRADPTKKDSTVVVVDPCQDFTALAIGSTVTGTVSATSCRGLEETFKYTVGAPSILSITLDPSFPVNFHYFGDHSSGTWYVPLTTPARTSRPILVAAGTYRVRVEALSTAQRGSFTLSAQATSLSPTICTIGATTGLTFSFPLNECEFTPQQKPAGVYRSMRFTTMPRLDANQALTVSVAATGFVPLIEWWFETASGPTAHTQSVPSTTTGTSLTATLTAPSNGGAAVIVVTSRDAAATGTFTLGIQGPPSGQAIEVDATSLMNRLPPLREP